eukprot:CAMPEP_0171323424 /NCGR_PEP_ID=MMETSP0816-20121228/115567_1 /TAXON_ID=420281 /ORGANISM="Proboscia inermis, Strain CCAP1064/1" /LENGTH=105 /DNA_ID=CAMNT_0011822129 /DNA_START=137 /DNA_END=454 /DNA_ORIENTATION=+
MNSSMEDPQAVKDDFENRVARMAVDSQRLKDERHKSFSRTNKSFQKERKFSGFRNFYVANSQFKESEAGHCNSYEAAEYYHKEAARKKQEFLSEIAADEAGAKSP